MSIFHGQIKNKNLVAKNTYEISIKLDHEISFSSGQYVWVILNDLKYEDIKGTRRAFSISSSPSNVNEISILLRESKSGYKRSLLEMSIGDKLLIDGPFGSSYVPKLSQKNIVMIAGGVGIAPFLSILRDVNKYEGETKFCLIYLNPTGESIALKDEIDQIVSGHKITYVNKIGEFSESLFPQGIDFKKDTFFVCGPKELVDSAYKALVKLKVDPNQMHFEQNYPTTQESLKEEDFIEKPGENNIMLQAIRESKNHVIVTDSNGTIVFANKTASRYTGYTFDEMRGNTPRLWGGLMPAEFYQNFWTQKQRSTGFDGEITNRRKNGEIYHVVAHISPILNSSNVLVGYIGTEEDVSEKKHEKEQIEKMNSFMIGRETKMAELKKEVLELQRQLDELKKKYEN